MYRAGIWGIAVAATVTWFAADAAAETTFVQGATRPGHTTFQVMTGYANIINREVPEVTVTVQQSGASVATTQLVESNRIQAGPVGNNAPYGAWRGLGKFEGKKTENIRTWTPMARSLSCPPTATFMTGPILKASAWASAPSDPVAR